LIDTFVIFSHRLNVFVLFCLAYQEALGLQESLILLHRLIVVSVFLLHFFIVVLVFYGRSPHRLVFFGYLPALICSILHYNGKMTILSNIIRNDVDTQFLVIQKH